jgi:DHA1 family bicyclomycin/chloramphenicol resistance-like MFS transporter
MQTQHHPAFITLLLMISFASVNAVLFTPALPDITLFFNIHDAAAQLTITWFLVGYALGQLLYGPIASRFGRKPTLYTGVSLQIISCFLCAAAGLLHSFTMLIIGRFLLALGSGVGLKMTFTIVNECYEPRIASQKISYLMLAFAITPGLGVALGGFLNTEFGWMSCFYASALYGLLLLFLTHQLPETRTPLDKNALKLKHLLHAYGTQFKNKNLVSGGLIMGSATCIVYIFAAIAPFIAITTFGLSSEEYGLANLLPPIGLISGSLFSARLVKIHPLELCMMSGIVISIIGVLIMSLLVYCEISVVFSIFMPMIVIYFGLSLVLANASTIAMAQTADKAHGSAVMSFINMGSATLVVIGVCFLPVHASVLPAAYLLLTIFMLLMFRRLQLKTPHAVTPNLQE